MQAGRTAGQSTDQQKKHRRRCQQRSERLLYRKLCSPTPVLICTYWDLGLLERRHQNQCRFAPHWARPFHLSYTPQWNKCCTRNGACRLYSVCMRRVYIVRADPFSSAGLHLRRLSANRIPTCHCHVVQASPFSCAGLHKRRLSAHRILTCRYVLWQCYLLTVVLYLLAMVR